MNTPPSPAVLRDNAVPSSATIPRALALPEILKLIRGFLAKKDLVRLLTVSHYFFASVVPSVWTVVQGPYILLKLLPNIDTSRIQDATWVENLQPLAHQSLERFNLYAPHVKWLTREPVEAVVLMSGAWDVLLKVVPNRPLLPNLQILELGFLHEDDKIKPMKYADAFLCASLGFLHISEPNRGYLDPLLASQLIQTISGQSPSINTLDIHTGDITPSSEVVALELKLRLNANLSAAFPRLNNLRSLGWGSEVLAPDVLVELGGLRNLDSLTINFPTNEQEPTVPDNICLPANSFTALKHIGIFCQSVRTALRFWSILPLVGRLVSAAINLDISKATNDQICDFICCICRSSPHITNLQVKLETKRNPQPVSLSSTVVESLRWLPLQRVQLTQARLAPDCSCEQLAMALPNTEYLSLPHQFFRFEDLAFVVKHMPMLHFLGIGLDLGNWPSETQLRLHSPTTHPRHRPLYLEFDFIGRDWFTSGDIHNESIESLSKALYNLWPNGVHCSFSRMACFYHGFNLDSKKLDLVNAAIQQLCLPKIFDAPELVDIILRWKYIQPHYPIWRI